MSSTTVSKRRTPSRKCPDTTEAACLHCKLLDLQRCSGNSTAPSGISHLQLSKGAVLMNSQQPFRGIHVVRTGCFKSFTLQEHYGEQILSFHLPGELIGLDALHSDAYNYNVQALEPSQVCLLSREELRRLKETSPSFQESLIRVLVEQVKQDQRQSLMVGKRTAEERLGAFFLNLAERYAKQGLPANGFRMPMMQIDIANHLGLAMETVSRTLRGFREMELMNIQAKQVRILNPGCLQSITQYCLQASPTPE
ncbi:MAG: cyclic nucleotide-binding domain-containing protein [Magnetococcales bacterium]|nr:cyclic nucleotide-binding domain-containing protein [Magnetococcales bacterium]